MEKIEHLWWPTPLWEVKTDFDTEFNQSILSEIDACRLWLQKNNAGQTNIWWMVDENPKTPNLKVLKNEILKTVTECAKKYFQNYNGTFQFNRGWLNCHKPGKDLKIHCHGDALLAVTYYLETPENSGDLVLIDPLGGVNFGWSVQGDMDGAKFKTIKPEESKLVFFPGHLLHMVEENKSSQVRKSLSSNIYSKL